MSDEKIKLDSCKECGNASIIRVLGERFWVCTHREGFSNPRYCGYRVARSPVQKLAHNNGKLMVSKASCKEKYDMLNDAILSYRKLGEKYGLVDLSFGLDDNLIPHIKDNESGSYFYATENDKDYRKNKYVWCWVAKLSRERYDRTRGLVHDSKTLAFSSGAKMSEAICEQRGLAAEVNKENQLKAGMLAFAEQHIKKNRWVATRDYLDGVAKKTPGVTFCNHSISIKDVVAGTVVAMMRLGTVELDPFGGEYKSYVRETFNLYYNRSTGEVYRGASGYDITPLEDRDEPYRKLL